MQFVILIFSSNSRRNVIDFIGLWLIKQSECLENIITRIDSTHQKLSATNNHQYMDYGGKDWWCSERRSNIERSYSVSITIILCMDSTKKRSICWRSREIQKYKERIGYCFRNCRRYDSEVLKRTNLDESISNRQKCQKFSRNLPGFFLRMTHQTLSTLVLFSISRRPYRTKQSTINFMNWVKHPN